MNYMKNLSMKQALGDTLLNLAKFNKNLYVVSMNLKSSLCLNKFAQKYPSRFIECGISENNAAGVAAGLAKTGKTVFLCSFSCFSPAINWATIKQSICYNNANVKIVGTHSGLLSGNLGATHQMLEDIAIMRALPNMEVFAPLDAIETEKIIQTVARSKVPSYIRLVRPETPIFFDNKCSFTIGQSKIIKSGARLTIIGYGPIILEGLKIKSAEIINCSSIKPLDEQTILTSIKKTKNVIVAEDHQQNGGLGEAIASLILTKGINCKFKHVAVKNKFGQSGNGSELYKLYNLNLKNYV
jgi:transketolase